MMEGLEIEMRFGWGCPRGGRGIVCKIVSTRLGCGIDRISMGMYPRNRNGIKLQIVIDVAYTVVDVDFVSFGHCLYFQHIQQYR